MNTKNWIRVIAIFKLLKGFVLVGVSFGIFRLIHADLDEVANRFLNLIRMDPDNHFIRYFLVKFVDLSPETIKKFGISALIYAILVLTEGFGLWFEQKWAEYLVIVASGIFLPIEVHEIIKHPTLLKCVVLGLNVLIISYLLLIVRSKKRRPHRKG